MRETLTIVMRMGHLQRLFPLWCLGLVLFALDLRVALVIAVIYGIMMQFVVEYVMHRFLYHREPPVEQSAFTALYRTHIGHHEFPNDPEFFTGDDRWFALRFGLVSFALYSLVLWPFLGIANALEWSAVALFLGSVSAYGFYEYCHTLAHLNVSKGWFGRHVTRSHLAHHYQDHNATFHVSFGAGWVDRLFGTHHDAEKARARYDRSTMMTIGMDPDDLRLVTARKALGLPKETPSHSRS